MVRYPEDVTVDVIEGSASLLIELRVHPDDFGLFSDEADGNFQAIQQVLSAAGGQRKPVLELVDASEDYEEE